MLRLWQATIQEIYSREDQSCHVCQRCASSLLLLQHKAYLEYTFLNPCQSYYDVLAHANPMYMCVHLPSLAVFDV